MSGYGIIDAYAKKQADEKFQGKLSEEQLKNISDVTNKQNQLSEEQIKNINDVQNKVPKEEGKGLSTNDYTTEEKQEVAKIKNKADVSYVKNTFANALKGTASGEAVAIKDVSPLEHTLDVKVRSKNIAISTGFNDIAVGNTAGTVIGVKSPTLEKGKTYTLSFDTENTGALLTFVHYGRPVTMIGSSDITADGTRRSFTFTMTDNYLATNYNITWVQLRSASTANSGLCSNAQLEEGEEATPYAPYVPDVSAVSLKKYGKNLLAYPYVATSKTVNGITFTDNGDGAVVANGTATSLAKFEITKPTKKPTILNVGKIYTLSGCPKGGSVNSGYFVTLQSEDGEQIISDVGDGITFTARKTTYFCHIRVASGAIVNNITFYPQLEMNPVATEYEKGELTTYIPNADGTVEGVTSLYPTTTLIADTGVVIDCEYNRDLNKAFAELEQKLTNAIISLGGNV